MRVSSGVQEFVRDVAHLCPRAHSALGTELQAHAAEFLRVKHEEAMQKIDAIVEMEQWRTVDVAPEFQRMVDAFARKQVPQVTETELLRLRDADPAAAALEGVAGSAKEIALEGVGYKVVGSALLLLTMIVHYMQSLASLPSVGAQVTHTRCPQAARTLLRLLNTLHDGSNHTHIRLFFFSLLAGVQVAHLLPALLRLFHTLTYKQILKGGAIRPESANLKVINFKHFACALQARPPLPRRLTRSPHVRLPFALSSSPLRRLIATTIAMRHARPRALSRSRSRCALSHGGGAALSLSRSLRVRAVAQPGDRSVAAPQGHPDGLRAREPARAAQGRRRGPGGL